MTVSGRAFWDGRKQVEIEEVDFEAIASFPTSGSSGSILIGLMMCLQNAILQTWRRV